MLRRPPVNDYLGDGSDRQATDRSIVMSHFSRKRCNATERDITTEFSVRGRTVISFSRLSRIYSEY